MKRARSAFPGLTFGLLLGIPVQGAGAATGPQGATPPVRAPAPARLSGALVLTPDADWRAKLEASPGNPAALTEAGTVPKGRKLALLIFFASAAVDAQGRAHLTCDVRFLRPDGKPAYEQQGVACFQGRPTALPGRRQLAMPLIEFIGESADPAGTWRVEVVLRDRLSRAAVPLYTAFTLR